jgi:hypothetical protein
LLVCRVASGSPSSSYDTESEHFELSTSTAVEGHCSISLLYRCCQQSRSSSDLLFFQNDKVCSFRITNGDGGSLQVTVSTNKQGSCSTERAMLPLSEEETIRLATAFLHCCHLDGSKRPIKLKKKERFVDFIEYA